MKNILFFGDSLTAGYGLIKVHEQSFPALLQQKLNQLNLDYIVINAGISGDTSADGLARIASALQTQVDIFVLELGANDMLRGLPAQDTENNLQMIINQVKEKYPFAKLLLLGMELPAWIPGERAEAFRRIYRNLARANQMAFVPFFLDGVAGVQHLNLVDGIHPLAEGYEIIAQNIWPVLKEIIEH
ncbi:arylesterase [Pedobacter sp. MC2016-14]|uniref:arylesterase n=1 Tax=Pedobacter sp. MC2016-14 TaxID=2897327 RepID=UPI001E64AACB|nr:arylesterase [Pedobacter sp. MC2016-14]MCD0490106.1 arylesterase [Pedobacter sp. MC2016-14]